MDELCIHMVENYSMEQKEKFPWTLLFFVTAGSFFSFGALIQLIDGLTTHYSFFFKISIGAFILAIVSCCISLFAKCVARN